MTRALYTTRQCKHRETNQTTSSRAPLNQGRDWDMIWGHGTSLSSTESSNGTNTRSHRHMIEESYQGTRYRTISLIDRTPDIRVETDTTTLKCAVTSLRSQSKHCNTRCTTWWLRQTCVIPSQALQGDQMKHLAKTCQLQQVNSFGNTTDESNS